MQYILTSQFTGEDLQLVATSADLDELKKAAKEQEEELADMLDDEPESVVPEPQFKTEQVFGGQQPGPQIEWVWYAGDMEYRIKEIAAI